jgi:hypothetical protein
VFYPIALEVSSLLVFQTILTSSSESRLDPNTAHHHLTLKLRALVSLRSQSSVQDAVKSHGSKVFPFT